ncbi:beta-ketoacyl-ACP synthase III [Lacticaseibacillus sp. GG6-2]
MRIEQTAMAVPSRVVTNTALSQTLDTSDEWIRQRTGICERRVATSETTYSLALAVAKQLLEASQLPATKIDFIIVATMSPDYLTPSEANRIQAAIEATNAYALSVNVACAGFVYALDLAAHLLQGTAKYGLVIGSEVLSKLVDWQDRSTAVLFGDGAGGVLLKADEQSLPPADLHSFGDSELVLSAGNALGQPFFKMNGRAVFQFAIREATASIQRLPPADWVLVHQANARIIDVIGRKLGLAASQLPMNMAAYGNTSAASIPILLHELVTAGRIKRGQTMILCGFGGGLSVSSLYLTY